MGKQALKRLKEGLCLGEVSYEELCEEAGSEGLKEQLQEQFRGELQEQLQALEEGSFEERERALLIQTIIGGQKLPLLLARESKRLTTPHAKEQGQKLWGALEAMERFYAPMCCAGGGILSYCVQSYEKILEESFRDDLLGREGSVIEGAGPSKMGPPEQILEDEFIEKETREQQRLDPPSPFSDSIGVCITLGGAGDRLDYFQNGEAMPVALYHFGGNKTLLEAILEEIALLAQRRGGEEKIPVALMVSDAKDGERRIREFLEQSLAIKQLCAYCELRLFRQICVPVFDRSGQWLEECIDGLRALWIKPGGHGALWRQGELEEIWSWFEERSCTKILVRQINNPLAWKEGRALKLAHLLDARQASIVFAATARDPQSSEGVHVVLESEGAKRSITQLEYSEIRALGLEQELEKGLYPANTNIFCIRLALIARLEKSALIFPKALVNFKAMRREGAERAPLIEAARLEMMMQNIIDVLPANDPPLFLYAPRERVISTIKKPAGPRSAAPQWPPKQTPQGCFEDLQRFWHLLVASQSEAPLQKGVLPRDLWGLYLDPALEEQLTLKELENPLKDCVVAPGSFLWCGVTSAQLHSCYIEGLLLAQGAFFGKKSVLQLHDCVIRNQGGHLKELEDISLQERLWSVWEEGSSLKGGLRIDFEGRGVFSARGIYFSGEAYFWIPDGWKLELLALGDQEEPLQEKPVQEEQERMYQQEPELRQALEKMRLPNEATTKLGALQGAAQNASSQHPSLQLFWSRLT